MAVHVRVSVEKNAGPGIHAEAREAGARVKEALRSVSTEAAAAGLDMVVHMKHRPPVEKAAPAAPADDGWPTGDLTRRSWRP